MESNNPEKSNYPSAPPTLVVQDSLTRFSITKTWQNSMGTALVPFGILFAGIAIWIGAGFFKDVFSGNAPVMFLVIACFFAIIPIVFIAVGTLISYFGLAMRFNKTTLVLENDTLSIRTSPFPLSKARSIHRLHIQQIFVKKGGASTLTITSGGTTSNISSAALYYIDENGREQSLLQSGRFRALPLPSLSDAEALWIEKELENRLGIEDQLVDTEVVSNKIQNKANDVEAVYEYTRQASLTPTPSTLLLDQTSDGIYIFKKWYNPIGYFLLFFAIMWFSILGTFISILVKAATSSLPSEGAPIGLFFVFLIPFVLAGFFILYKALATLLNTTTIALADGFLTILYTPIRFKREQVRLALAQIRNIHPIQEKRRGSKGRSYMVNFVRLELQDGQVMDILSNSETALAEDECNFLVIKLQEYLQKQLER